MKINRPIYFSDREREVADLLSSTVTDGDLVRRPTLNEIAAQLGIARTTAKYHCDSLRFKLGVRSRAEIPEAYRKAAA